MTSLFLSSDKAFYTLEGEGPSVGRPAVFIRFSMCNLTCKGWATPENPNGCDSASAWMVRNKFTFEELDAFLEKEGLVDRLNRGALLKITGGEPTIQQNAILEYLVPRLNSWGWPYIEIETNCTIEPDPKWLYINRDPTFFICSPKLSNNGDPLLIRYKPSVLQWHADNPCSYFKFVVQNEEDLEEVNMTYVESFRIPRSRVWLMPEGATREAQQEKALWVAEKCKIHGYNFSQRLQIFIWNRALGV